jgi:hypothetical protein
MTSGNLYKVHVKFDTEILGTAPGDPSLYETFITAKKFADVKALAKAGKLTEEEQAAYKDEQDALAKEELETLATDSKGITVFRRDPTTKALIIPDFCWRGFLKEAASAVGDNAGKTWGLTSKIDKWVFIVDKDRKPLRYIPLTRDGNPILSPDGIFSRPLRAQTMQGPRVAISVSEIVAAGAEADFYIYVFPLGAGKHKLDETILKAWFEYGAYQGMMQWRSGGFGRMTVDVTPV